MRGGQNHKITTRSESVGSLLEFGAIIRNMLKHINIQDSVEHLPGPQLGNCSDSHLNISRNDPRGLIMLYLLGQSSVRL